MGMRKSNRKYVIILIVLILIMFSISLTLNIIGDKFISENSGQADTFAAKQMQENSEPEFYNNLAVTNTINEEVSEETENTDIIGPEMIKKEIEGPEMLATENLEKAESAEKAAGFLGPQKVELPETEENKNKKIDDWRLTLVNAEHELPIDFEPKLDYIDDKKQIDARVAEELEQMLKDMKKDKVKDGWVQSAYRSISYQTELFNNKVNYFMEYDIPKDEAIERTLKVINKPGTSEHNLGLAIDFDYVNYEFEDSAAFKWLRKNAEDYGFILRYRPDKEEITKVSYEPWHWRYVGVEHAKKINELDMCLEEYIEYLKTH